MADPISIKTQGTLITVENASATPVAVGGHDSITGLGGGSATEIDETTMASLAKEFRPGLQDNGTVSINFKRRNHSDPGQAEFISMRALQATREVEVTQPEGDDDIIRFRCWVVSFTTDGASDSIYQGVLTLRVTGVYEYDSSAP